MFYQNQTTFYKNSYISFFISDYKSKVERDSLIPLLQVDNTLKEKPTDSFRISRLSNL